MAEQELASETRPVGEAVAVDEFRALLKREFRPREEEAEGRIDAAVRTLAEQALANTRLVGDDALKSIQALIAAIDRKLTEQLDLVLYHPEFQALEVAWQGLWHLVNDTETHQMLKINVRNITKQELSHTLEEFEGTAWDQSPIFKKVYN